MNAKRKETEKMKTLRKIISHNQGQTLAIVIIAVLVLWTYGCESKVSSILEPSLQVNREDLQVEVDSEIRRLEGELEHIAAKAQAKVHDLDRQDAFKKKLFDFAAIAVEGSGWNPSGLVGLAFSVFGIGAVIDNRIKDKVIKNRPIEKKA